MVFPISLQAPYHAPDRHQFRLAERGDAAGRVSTAQPTDFTPDRMRNAGELPGVLLAR
jgi:hypothetical protein